MIRLKATHLGLHWAVLLAVLFVSRIGFAQIRVEHPRIFLTPALVATLHVVGNGDADLKAIADYVDRRFKPDKVAATISELQGNDPGYVCQPTFFTAAVLGDATHVAEAIQALETLAAIAPSVGYDMGTRARLMCLAEGYDWLVDQLSPADNLAVRDAIVGHVAEIQSYIDAPDFVSGHSRWGNTTALAGALAIHGDDNRLDATLATVLSNWTNGYNPVLADVGLGGGHPMGWQYGPDYSDPRSALMWRSATVNGETWNPLFLGDVAYFHIYAANGNGVGDYPLLGDCWEEAFNGTAVDQLAVASGVGGNGYAESFYQGLEAADAIWEPFRVMRAMTRAGAAAPLPIQNLPLSRLFSGAGILVARDSWNRSEATTLTFKSSPFYSLGHHHRDEGSFLIDYRGGLLTEGGYYDYYDSDHHRNFYTRSVAHNTLLVHWPGEPLRAGYVDDGGQKIPVDWSDEPTTAGDLHAKAGLGGVTGSSDAGACVWVKTDLSKAYASGKLTSYTRDVLELRHPGGATHPAILTVDKAVLPEARSAGILWHFAQNVAVSGARVSAESVGGGHLRLDVIRPNAPTITPMTGGDRFKVAGSVHDRADASSTYGRTTPYWGHVEVSPQGPMLTPEWSTLLRVGDASLDADALTATDIGGADWSGARLGDTIFAVAQQPVTHLDLPAGAPLADGCIAGLAPNAMVEVAVGASPALAFLSNADGIVVYDPSMAVMGSGASSVASTGAASASSSASVGAGGGSAGSGGAGAGGSSATGGGGASSANAGVGGAASGNAGAGGATGGAGSTVNRAEQASGCGCRAAGAGDIGPFSSAMGVLSAALIARARRRRTGALRRAESIR